VTNAVTRKLIEVALPLDAINKESAGEVDPTWATWIRRTGSPSVGWLAARSILAATAAESGVRGSLMLKTGIAPTRDDRPHDG